MDLFNRKALNELQDRLRQVESALAVERALVRAIDQELFQISQQPSFERMRPFLQKLTLGMEQRMRLESNRIKGIIFDELSKVS